MELGRRFGSAYPPSRAQSLDIAFDRAADSIGVGTLAELLERVLENDPRALDAVVKETSIGETYFFREEDGYTFVQKRLLALVDKRSRGSARESERAVRLWSAGCASGEEAYSLAIVALETVGADVEVEVVGTDLNAASIARALAASYGPWSFRGVSPERKAAWFEASGKTAHGEMLRPIEAVRRRVKFASLNLAQDHGTSNAWPAMVDLIFCRNVLLYFSSRQLPAVARRFSEALAPSGRLVLGATDPSLTSAAMSRTAQVPPVYRRAGEVAQRRLRAFAGDSLGGARPYGVGDSVETDAAGARASDPGDELVRDLRAPARAKTKVATPRPTRTPLVSPTIAARAEPAKDDALARAQALADAGDYPAAAACLDAALAQTPLEAPLHVLRGMVALSAGDAAQALRRADAALLLDSSLGMAHLLAAMAAAKESDAERSARSARNALAAFVQSDDPPACARESRDDLIQACQALLRQTKHATQTRKSGRS